MRTQTNPRRCVVVANIGKQKQHKQRAPLRPQVDTPFGVLFYWLSRRITGVHMPPCVSGVIRMRKPDWKSAESLSWNPSAHAYQLIERGVQHRRVRRLAKWLLWTITEPNNRTRPCSQVIRIAARLAPKNLARIGRDFSREGILQ